MDVEAKWDMIQNFKKVSSFRLCYSASLAAHFIDWKRRSRKDVGNQAG